MLSINEIFASYQGEGINTGVPAVFIRLSGCNLSCSWCDTKYHTKGKPMSVDKAVQKALVESQRLHTRMSGVLAIVTGGEPLIQSDTPALLLALENNGFIPAIETNGTKDPLEVGVAMRHNLFLAVAPKSVESVHQRCLIHSSEIKIVVDDSDDAEKMIRYVLSVVSFGPDRPIWLQPEGNRGAMVKKAQELTRIDPRVLRVGHQMHKLRSWK